LDDLPRIDLVLLSHNHYDHLDLATLRALSARGDCTFVVPLGVGDLLRAEKIGPVHELDWGESRSLLDFTVHSVPAMHFSSRGIFDRNKTLWCGYVIESRERRVYFAGDTGFGSHFAQIREKHGTPSLALLPIGAYEPRWFMSPVHMDPQEAVKAHRILGAKTSIAIHHGTFQLADEGIDAASKELIACAGGESFLILNNGEFADLA
jgi:L-ascorbate metabolism protein UlaG (beta-lactamase superfamily)